MALKVILNGTKSIELNWKTVETEIVNAYKLRWLQTKEIYWTKTKFT